MSLARFDDHEVFKIAKRHLAQLAEQQRAAPAELPVTGAPRLRQLGRGLWNAGSKLLDLLEIAGRFLVNPRHVPGRWAARVRLLEPTKTFNLWKLGLLAFAGLLGYLTFAHLVDLPTFMRGKPDWRRGATAAVLGSLFTGTVVGLLASLWNDLVRLPYIAHRIRRQVRKRPGCVLLSDIGRHAVRLVPRDEPVEIVPRTDLFDELTPGVLQRKRKDVQIVVGDPGAGKTTALIGIAGFLARLGVVPVLVPLRSVDDGPLIELGRRRFKGQIQDYVRSDGEAELLWRWLARRRRVAILTDDMDRLSREGERGFVLRMTIKEVQTADLPIVVTARPAGVPAGIAASAIDLDRLDEEQAIDCVATGAREDPSFSRAREVPRQSLARWVHAGQLVEVPYYLELLAQLAAAGRDVFPELSDVSSSTIATDRTGLVEPSPDGSVRWNPWWVRFLLIDHYYDAVCSGGVRRWTGIETRERRSAMRMLQDAALGVLLSQAAAARAKVLPREEQDACRPERTGIEDFIRTDDRDRERRARTDGTESPYRPAVSAHEVIETAERLRIIDRDAVGNPQFRHRITQAYLAGRLLADIERKRRPVAPGAETDWIGLLLDSRNPEKLTAHTALTFAALYADRERRNAEQRRRRDGHAGAKREQGTPADWACVGQRILRRLVDGAAVSLRKPHAKRPATELSKQQRARRSRGPDDLNPQHVRDPEARFDSDDGLIKLTTAADIAHAIACDPGGANGRGPKHEHRVWDRDHRRPAITQRDILALIGDACYVTRWTKLNAIKAIAALETEDRWRRIWAYARDADYAVRQAASRALQRDATAAYRVLEADIQKLIVRAAALSAHRQELEKEIPDEDPKRHGERRDYYVGMWTADDVRGLQALGTVLPAIVSGLQEDPAVARTLASWQGRNGGDPGASHSHNGQPSGGDGVPSDQQLLYERHARTALDDLVAISFQGGYHVLERTLAQGFRGDAMRHVAGTGGSGVEERAHAGPGWVAAHARLVTTVGLCQAEHWYAQLVLGQALALYTIAGANRKVTYDVLARCLHRGGPHRHPFTQEAVRLARTAVRRHSIGSARWSAFIYGDEVAESHRRQTGLTDRTAQLLGDVTVLLDLGEGAQEDRQEASAHMNELPYCLAHSGDRREVLGTGCPPECGWNLCPYKQPPPDEPNEHHGVSRAFCRQQRWIARHHKPSWQGTISRRRLADFWQEMERRART